MSNEDMQNIANTHGEKILEKLKTHSNLSDDQKKEMVSHFVFEAMREFWSKSFNY